MPEIIPVILMAATIQAAQPVVISTPELEIRFTPRTPEQMVSFYEARGFPENMLNIIKQQCFITVGISSLSKQKIWLDLSRWEFSSADKSIKREHRDYWKNRWSDMEIPLGNQSTFRWTLLPESLDFIPGEHEGGNIILPFTKDMISLTASFATGDNKQGEEINLSTDSLFCAEDPQ